jgi:ribosome-binding factor A
MRRVNELLREVIAEAVMDLKDPGLGFLTITAVDTSPDLRSAIVFYSVLGTEEEEQATDAALKRAASHVQSAVGSQVRIKYTPVLEFRRDDALERGLRINRILHEIEAQEAAEAAEAAEATEATEAADGANARVGEAEDGN